MANIIDYVKSCDRTFAEQPLNRVDSLVFSWLAYVRIPEDVPESLTPQGKPMAEVGSQDNLLGLVAPLHDARLSEELLRACASSVRFGPVVAAHAVDVWSPGEGVQFSATTFLIPENVQASVEAAEGKASNCLGAYVAFRGTDDTLVGWKENFSMAFSAATPAQLAATAYVQEVAADYGVKLWLGGHSKGGNLAVYALNTCEAPVRNQVQRCFAHDAPGFIDETTQAANWANAEDKVDRTIPEESIVGLLLNSPRDQMVVVKSTNPGIYQHAPFSWVVEGSAFAEAHSLSYDSYRTNKRLSSWLATMDAPDRERFVEVLFKLASATGEITVSGISSTLADGSLDLALRRLDGLPEADRSFFLEAVEDLIATMLLGPAPANPQTPQERADAAADRVEDISVHFDDRISKMDKYLGL